MFDQTTIADNVTRWTGYGIKLPKDLSTAIAAFEALRYTEVGYQPVFDVASVTETNAEDKIRAYADQLMLAEVPGGGQSVLERAKRHAVETAARTVNAQARKAVPEVIAQLTPEFDQHAQAYTSAVAKLPLDPDVQDGRKSTKTFAELLVAAGPDALDAFKLAREEAAYLNRISAWVVSAGQVSGGVAKQVEVTLRILRPTDTQDLIRLDSARTKITDPTRVEIDPVLYVAARRRVPFGINTLQEAAALRQQLTTPVSTAKTW